MSKEETETEPAPEEIASESCDASVPCEISPKKRYVAELIGTMVLVLVGTGTAVVAGSYVGAQGIAIAFGLAVLAMVYAIGGVSGCHINPAVSISMYVADKLSGKDTVFYVIFQCIGAVIGSGILYAIMIGNPGFDLATVGLGANTINNYSLLSVIVAEAVLTFIFVLVIHGSTHERVPRGFAGIAIGLALVFVHLVSIPIDNTSVNPARSLGPAVFVGGNALIQLWVFWVAPIIGGVIAAYVWKLFK